jgi:hypothetical protein
MIQTPPVDLEQSKPVSQQFGWHGLAKKEALPLFPAVRVDLFVPSPPQ